MKALFIEIWMFILLGKYQERKTGFGVRIGKTKPEAYPWLLGRRGKTVEDTKLSTDSFAESWIRKENTAQS